MFDGKTDQILNNLSFFFYLIFFIILLLLVLFVGRDVLLLLIIHDIDILVFTVIVTSCDMETIYK